MEVTLKTIAQKVNVSDQAVSAVLNNKTNCRVSREKRELILKVAKELGYTSSISAQIMCGKPTKTAAILISTPYMKNEEHLWRIVMSLLNRFNAAGYGCIYAVSENNEAGNLKLVANLISRGARMFVMIGQPYGMEKLEARIHRQGGKTIAYGSAAATRYVESDFDDAISKIVRFFQSSGYGDFRSFVLHSEASGTRLKAFRKALPELSMAELETKHLRYFEMPDTWSFAPEALFKIGYDATEKLLAEEPGIQSIFYYSDFFALGGAHALARRGYRIGEDILIAGLNNIVAVRSSLVPISSISHDADTICDLIYDALVNDRDCGKFVPAIPHLRTIEDFTREFISRESDITRKKS